MIRALSLGRPAPSRTPRACVSCAPLSAPLAISRSRPSGARVPGGLPRRDGREPTAEPRAGSVADTGRRSTRWPGPLATKVSCIGWGVARRSSRLLRERLVRSRWTWLWRAPVCASRFTAILVARSDRLSAATRASGSPPRPGAVRSGRGSRCPPRDAGGCMGSPRCSRPSCAVESSVKLRTSGNSIPFDGPSDQRMSSTVFEEPPSERARSHAPVPTRAKCATHDVARAPAQLRPMACVHSEPEWPVKPAAARTAD